MMITRPQVISTSGKMCVERRIVCCSPRFLISSRTCRIWFGSRPIVGSSRISRSGSASSASASPTLCRYPLERVPISLFSTLLRPHSSFTSPSVLDALEGRAITQVLCYPHVAVEWHVFRHVAEMRSCLERLFEYVESRDRCPARGRRHEARQNTHRSSLACTVRP